MAMFKIEEIAQTFEYHLRVGIPDRIQSVFDELFEELGRIGHIEIAGNGQIPTGGVVLSEKRMAVRHASSGVGAVSQMSKVDLSEKITRRLQFGLVLRVERRLPQNTHVPGGGVEYACQGISLGRPHSSQERDARGHVEFDRGDAGAILSTVALLLHQKMKAPQTPRRVSVTFLNDVERLFQPHQCQTTFMTNWITQGGRRVLSRADRGHRV